MKKISAIPACLVMLAMLMASGGSSGLAKLNGTWRGDGAETLKALEQSPLDETEREMAITVFNGIQIIIDVRKRTITMARGDIQDTGDFSVISDDGERVSLKNLADGSVMIFEPGEEGFLAVRGSGDGDRPMIMRRVR